MANNKGFTAIELVCTIIGIVMIPASVYGWVNNIVVIFHSSFTPLTGKLVLRCAGIVIAPLGAVMGYL